MSINQPTSAPPPSAHIRADINEVTVSEVKGHPGIYAIHLSEDIYLLATIQQWRDNINAKVEAGFGAAAIEPMAVPA